MTKAGEPHMAAAKKVLRYLQSRKKIPLKWCAIDNALPGVIHGYADAPPPTFPTHVCPQSATSSSSTEVPYHGAQQKHHCRCAAEAEIVSLSSAAQECLFLRKLCIEMGFHQHRPTIIYEDCEAAVALSKETRFRKRSKHIALRWHFIAERQDPQVADLNVIHRRRTKMLADIFASPRAAPTFIAFRDHILGLRSAFVADDDEV